MRFQIREKITLSSGYGNGLFNPKMKKAYLYPLILFLLTLLPLYPFIHPGIPITHDGQDHVARIANFYQSLLDGNLIPRWAGNLNWGYGHPILMFLYPLPSYIASIFAFVGFSFPDSVKLVFVVGFIASAFAMYAFVKEQWSEDAAFVAAAVYTFAPYRFVDLYVRGAIGEHLAFVFPPLVLLSMVLLAKRIQAKYVAFGVFSLAGLILSHNAISLMFLPIIFGFAVYLFFQVKHKKRFGISIFFILLFGFGLAAFFWIPALLEGKYTLRDIVTADDYRTRFVFLQQLVYGPWSFGGTGKFSVQIGIVQWLFVLVAIPLSLRIMREKRTDRVVFLALLTVFMCALFLMTSYSKLVWESVSLLQKFQFPWRFLSVALFVPAVLSAWATDILQGERKKFYVIGVCTLLLLTSQSYWKAQAYQQKPEVFYTGIYDSTTDTGESAPIWSVRFMEKRPKERIAVIEGTAAIEELYRSSTRHEYSIDAKTDVRILENTLYFPGWNVFVDNAMFEVNALEFQDPKYRGLMTFRLPAGTHTVSMQFQETKLRYLSDILSLISFIGVILFVILEKQWKRYL
jgi:uncharacterized membrane protein